jgi:hypothetical protein
MTRRHLWLLGALIVAAAAYLLTRSTTPTAPGGAAAPRAAARATAGGGQSGVVGDVRLEELEGRTEGRPERIRNLFQFEARPAPVAPTTARGPIAPPPPPGPPVPALPPPPPPIPLRYIGYLDRTGAVPRVAVLSDGRGNVFNGKEGDIIEGRYRVLRIGTDSADLVYVDGRGRQTIRLSGQ